MKFVTATIMVILVTVATESWAANKTVSSSSGVTKTSGTTVSAKPSRSLFLPKTSTSVSYYPKKTVRISSSTSHFPQPTYVPKTKTSFNSTDTEDDESNATVSITTTTSTTPPPKSQDKKMDRSGLADSEIYQAPVRRTSLEDELSVYVPDNISLKKLNADRKMSTYFGKSSYIQRPESTKLDTSPVTILVHASPDKVPKIKPKRKNLSMTPTKKRSDFKTTYSTIYPATSSTYNTRSYQATPNYKSSSYRSRSIPALSPTASPYTSSSSSYETTMSPNYHSSESTTVPTTQAGLVNYMVRNLLMQANVMNQLLPLVQQIASQVPSVLADVEAAKNQLAFSQAKDELTSTVNNAVNQYNSNNNKGGNGMKIKRPPQSYSSPVQSSSSNVYHQDDRDTNYYTNIKHKPTTSRSYGQSKTNTEVKSKPVNKFDPNFYPTRPVIHHMQDEFYQSEDNFGEEDQFRPYHSHEKAKVTQGPFSSLQVGNKEYTLPTFKISLNTDSDSGRPGSNKVALGERPYFTMGDNDQGRPSDNRVAESFAKNAYYEGNLPKSTQSVVNSVVPIVLQLHHSRKQKERDQTSSVIKVVEVKETRSHNPHMPSPTIVEVVEEKEDRKPSNPVIQVIEVKDGKRKSSPHNLNTDSYGNHESFGQESILKVEGKNPHQQNLDDKYEELKKAVLKEAAFREATFKEAARIVKNLQHMDSSTLNRLPDAIRDHAFHHHGDGIEDNFEHSASSRPGKILGPFHRPVKDRFKDFFDESERFKDDLKMSSDDLGHAMMKHHHNFKDSSFSEISQSLRHSQKDSIPLPTNPESIGLEGAQLEVLKEAIAKAMEEEKRGGNPKDIHVMPRPLNHHNKHNSEDDLLKLFNNEHKFNHKPKVHLIPLKHNNEHHNIEFHSIEDASPQNAASLSEETKKVLEKYSAIDVIEPNHMMHRPHPFLFPSMHPPPFPFPRLPMPGPFPHVPMPHGPMPRPFPPRPFPMVPFPYGPRPPHLPPHLPPHGPPRGPFPHPMLPPPRPPMGPFPRPFLPPLPHPPPFKKRNGDDEETPEEHATEKKDNVAKTEVKA